MTAYETDIEVILGHRHDNGGDFWSTPDGRIYVGNPFSTISSRRIRQWSPVGDRCGADPKCSTTTPAGQRSAGD